MVSPGPDRGPPGSRLVSDHFLSPPPRLPPAPPPRRPQPLPPLLKLHHASSGHLHPHVQSTSLSYQNVIRILGVRVSVNLVTLY